MSALDVTAIIVALISAIAAIIVAFIQRPKQEKPQKDRVLLPENAKIHHSQTQSSLSRIFIALLSIIALISTFVYFSSRLSMSENRTAIPSQSAIAPAIQLVNPNTSIPNKASISTAIALSEEADLIFSAPNMVELKPVKGGIAFSFASVNLRDLIVEAIFQNPDSEDWSYGFSIRRKGEATDNFDLFDIYIRSDKRWFFNRQQKVYGQEQVSTYLSSGIIETLDVRKNGANKIRVLAKDYTAYLFVNDLFIDTLDISSINEPGNVVIVTNLDSSLILYDEPTFVNGFKIWSLDN